MKYLEKSFTVPPADLRKGVNSHGQTWEDIFSQPQKPPKPCPYLETINENPHGCYMSNETADGYMSPNCWVVHGPTCPRAANG